MRTHHSLSKTEDANAAAVEAAKGGLWGATKWGIPALALGVLGHQISPIYRALTIQFKVYLQLSGMTLGGYLEADRRIRRFEHEVRLRKRAERDNAVWQRWQGLVAVNNDEDQKKGNGPYSSTAGTTSSPSNSLSGSASTSKTTTSTPSSPSSAKTVEK